MGGLWKYMPKTWFTSLLGSLALIGTPFFSGFYSKDSIIEAVMASHLPTSGFAQFAVLAGVFVTAFYSFRMYFLVFHGKENFGHAHHGHDDHHDDGHHHGLAPGEKPHESPAVVWVPLVLLAIPSVFIGLYTIQPMLFGDFFKDVIFVNHHAHPAMEELAHEFHSWQAMGVHALQTKPFWLAVAGVATAYFFYMVKPSIPAAIKQKASVIYNILENKYYMDRFNEIVFAGGARLLGGGLWNVGDKGLIDGLVVNGSAKLVGLFSKVVRLFQTGFIYHYAFVMILGVLGFLIYFMPLPFSK
jgi:NADH-quinone oxidoreductase subunit L